MVDSKMSNNLPLPHPDDDFELDYDEWNEDDYCDGCGGYGDDCCCDELLEGEEWDD
jgi:hypothetical protein